jgi:hypothetical protein
LVLQEWHSFIHKLGTLREEFVCAVSERLLSLKIKFLTNAEKRHFAREDEIRCQIANDEPQKHGLRMFPLSSLVDSNECWREVAMKCFPILTQLEAPTFFFTFTRTSIG